MGDTIIVTVVSPFHHHVSPFRYSMCRRFGYMCVAVLVCLRFDQLPFFFKRLTDYVCFYNRLGLMHFVLHS